MAGQPKLPVTNMSKGEFAPKLYARPDVPEYQAGVKKAENFIIQKEAGMAFRPGFRFCGELGDVDGIYRLQPFILSSRLATVRLFGHYGMELLAQGGFVLEEVDLKIVSLTYEAQAVLEIPYHGFAVGDRLYLNGNTGPRLDGRTVTIVAVLDEDHVRVDLNTLGMSALTASTGIVRTSTPTPPPPPPEPLPEPEPEPEPPTSGGDGGGGTIGRGAGGFPPHEY